MVVGRGTGKAKLELESRLGQETVLEIRNDKDWPRQPEEEMRCTGQTCSSPGCPT